MNPRKTLVKFTKSFAILPNSDFPKPASLKPSNHRSQKLPFAQANNSTTQQSTINPSFLIPRGLEHLLLPKRILAEGIHSRETPSQCCQPWVDSKITTALLMAKRTQSGSRVALIALLSRVTDPYLPIKPSLDSQRRKSNFQPLQIKTIMMGLVLIRIRTVWWPERQVFIAIRSLKEV